MAENGHFDFTSLLSNFNLKWSEACLHHGVMMNEMPGLDGRAGGKVCVSKSTSDSEFSVEG